MKLTISINDLKIPTVAMNHSDGKTTVIAPATTGKVEVSLDADMQGLLNIYSPSNIAAAIENNIRIVTFLAENGDKVQGAISTVLDAVTRIATYRPGLNDSDENQAKVAEAYDAGYNDGYHATKAPSKTPGECHGDDCPDRCDGINCPSVNTNGKA